jgi:hypothetical protein
MVLSKDDKNYRQCSITVMDNIADPDISFDEQGVSNYYHEYKDAEKDGVLTGEAGKKKIEDLVKTIKEAGKWKSI